MIRGCMFYNWDVANNLSISTYRLMLINILWKKERPNDSVMHNCAPHFILGLQNRDFIRWLYSIASFKVFWKFYLSQPNHTLCLFLYWSHFSVLLATVLLVADVGTVAHSYQNFDNAPTHIQRKTSLKSKIKIIIFYV